MNIINLVKAGQKVWSPVLGDCTITNFSKTENYICITDSHSHRYKLNNEGKFYNNEKLKIVIYPSLYNKNWLTMDTSSVKPGDYLINIFDGSAIILKDFNNEYFNGICDIRNDKVDNKPILVDRYKTKATEELGRETLEEQKDTLLLDNISNEQLRQERDIVRQRSEGKNSLINLGD